MNEIPHNRLVASDAEADAVAAVVRTGFWACGQQVAGLETALAEMAQMKRAVCVASGLSALRLGLKALGIRPGDRVIVPAYSCVALPNAILACGAVPHPVDISPLNWNIDPTAVRRVIDTEGAAAVIAVNMFGAPAPVEELMCMGVPVVEDCAHAFGISVHGTPLGKRGTMAVLSFYATKLIGAGEGGAVVTDNIALAERVLSWRDYTNQAPDKDRLNEKMSDLEAALAHCRLDKLDRLLARRAELAQRYNAALGPLAEQTDGLRIPRPTEERIWYRYVVELRDMDACAMIDALKRRGVHAQRPVTDWRGENTQNCPVADNAYRHVVSLPLYPSLTDEEQKRVIEAFMSVFFKA